MRIGTPYFPSFDSACRYYAPSQSGCHSWGAFSLVNECAHCMCEPSQHVREVVLAKIKRGEIHIGKPTIKPGERLVLVDEQPGKRWHVEASK
jgi:hypothetical protein